MTSDAATELPQGEIAAARVRRRHVFYVSGFDPRGPVGYYALFRREFWKFHKASGVATTISKLAMPQGSLEASWTARCDAGAWQTETSFSFLRWDDIIQRVYFRPDWQRMPLGLIGLLTGIFNGQMSAIGRESRRFLVIFYGTAFFYLAYAAVLLAVAGIAAAALAPLAGAIGLPRWTPAIATVAIAYLAFTYGVKATRGPPLYVSHLVDDMNFNWGYLRGHFGHVDRRIADFAALIAARIAAAEDDEILIVAHSSGPVLAAEALALALARDPDLGRRGPAVGFVSLGSAIPWCGLDPAAARLREAIRRLVAEPDVLWVDFQAQWDWLAFWRHDPATACGVSRAGRRNPMTRKVFIDEVMTPETRAATKYNFFRRHFQFLMNGDGPASYDYFAIVCGPDPLSVLAVRPPRARMSLTADPAATP